MLGERVRVQDRLFYEFDLEDRVPSDHLLRRIDGVLDLSWLRAELPPFCSHTGRPSVCPELMLRMLLIGYCYSIRSERRLCQEVEPHFAQLTNGLGADWRITDIALKPYACGTIAQPFTDAAVILAEQGIEPVRISEIRCKVGEGTVHRLWEPGAEKIRPSTPYSAKFSVPYCVAVGMLDRAAGLAQFTQARIADPDLLALAAKVHYDIDPANAFPTSYTAHLTVTLEDGRIVEAEQPHLRGDRHEPLSDEALAAKFAANAAFGGWPADRAAALEQFVADVFDRRNLSGLRAFRV